jgi:hypothetical protein
MNQFRLLPSKLAAVVLLALCTSVYAQKYIDVNPGFSTLNDAVKSNTDPTAIFRLQRGDQAVYLLNGAITNTIPLRIEAAEGTGALPKIYPGIGTGGTSTIPFYIKANFTLKNVYIAAKDEAGAFLSQMLRVQADNVRLIVDGCFLENSAQSAIRTDNKMAKIYLKNTTIRNCVSDYSNGRGIDDRGVDMDTLYIENCTINNIGSRFLRDGGGILNYAYVNHNTFVNLGLEVMQFGECPKVIFTNNIVVNGAFLGRLKSGNAAGLELKPLSSAVYQGVKQSVQLDHNNFYLDPAIIKLYPDSAIAVNNYDTLINSYVKGSALENTNISEAIAFTTPPPAVNELVTLYWKDPALSGSETALGLRATGDYNFKYATTAASYSGGTGGQPIGALTWFDMPLGLEDNSEMPKQYLLSQNYPNPFNPATKIRYSLASPGIVSLDVYDIMGRKITSLVNDFRAAGQYEVSWNGKNSYGVNVTSGIYFYKITTENFTQTKQMLLVK